MFSLRWCDHLDDSVRSGLSSQLVTQTTTYCSTSNEFRKAPELSSKWSELCCVACLNSSDSLLLQLMIGEIFGNISSFRYESVVHAMKIREEYDGETSSKPVLPLRKDIVAYISEYVCRKTRDRI